MAAEPKKQRASPDSLEADKARIVEAFVAFDTDGDDFISREELRDALGRLGLRCTEETLSKLMDGRTRLGQRSRAKLPWAVEPPGR